MKIYGGADKDQALKQNSGELSAQRGGFGKVVWMIKNDFLSLLVPIGLPTLGLAPGGKAKVKRARLSGSIILLQRERERLALIVASHTEGKGQDKWIVSRSLAS